MDLGDDEQEQAAKAKRKLKRRSKKKSAKAKNAAGAAPHAPVSAPPARRRAARALGGDRASGAAGPGAGRGGRAAPRPLPKIRVFPQLSEVQKARLRMKDQEHIRRGAAPRGRHAEQERNAFLERIQAEEVRREQARIAAARPVPPPPNRATGVVVQTIDAIALDSNLELTRVDMEVRRSTVGVYEDSLACQLLGQTYFVHPDKTIKITVDLVVTSEVIGAFPRTAPGRAEVHIKELGFHFVDPLAPIAEKEIVPRPLDDGHLIVELKYLQAMHVKNRMLKKCCYTLYLVELADRLRAEASRETLKTARKNVVEFDMVVLAPDAASSASSRTIARKAAEARGETVPTPYDETAVDAVVVTAVPPVAPVVAPEPARRRRAMGATPASATLVADGAKKVVFQYGRPGNGTDYLVARWRASRRRTRSASSSTSSRRASVAAAAADELPVDRLQRVPDPGLMNLPTIWPRMRFPFRERFYGINDRAKDGCPAGKVMALASIPGVAKAGDGCIVFGLYDSKVEVSIQEKNRISEVVVARIEEHNVARAGAEKPLPPLHTAASTAAVANFYRDPCGLLEPRARAAQPARVAKLYVVPNCEVVTPPPPPIYHVTENGERLLVLYAASSGR
ncbi:hypothetical protein JL720_17007 [Aureococcus anophagefferens]|nr:hypothetical protein JL720_17007 [Aureococcus anophagefferens]